MRDSTPEVKRRFRLREPLFVGGLCDGNGNVEGHFANTGEFGVDRARGNFFFCYAAG